MKRSKLFTILTLTSVLFVSCEKETDSLLKDLEQQQSLALLNADALRSTKISRRSGIFNGEKGHDHRDILGHDDLSISYTSTSELQKGDIIVTDYDEETEMYTAEIYWGEEISEEDKSLFFDAHVYMIFKRQGYGELTYTYYDGYKCVFSHSYYKPGDKFTFTKSIWWSCTDVEVRMYYRNPEYPHCSYGMSWTRPFSSLRYYISEKK